jgi:hypothetical protein
MKAMLAEQQERVRAAEARAAAAVAAQAAAAQAAAVPQAPPVVPAQGPPPGFVPAEDLAAEVAARDRLWALGRRDMFTSSVLTSLQGFGVAMMIVSTKDDKFSLLLKNYSKIFLFQLAVLCYCGRAEVRSLAGEIVARLPLQVRQAIEWIGRNKELMAVAAGGAYGVGALLTMHKLRAGCDVSPQSIFETAGLLGGAIRGSLQRGPQTWKDRISATLGWGARWATVGTVGAKVGAIASWMFGGR